MTQLEQAGEPSMEDILASIRKIIAEDPPGSRALPEVRAEPAAPSVTNRIFQRMGEAVRSEQAKPAATPAAISEPYLRSSMPSLSSLPSGAPAAEAAKPFDIDAQMAEVLSKTRGGAPRRDVEPSFGPTLPEVQAALDSLSLASNVPATPAPLSRPGFTVARDGFVPDAPNNSPINAQVNTQMNAPAKSSLNDPFEFSLGPSPFAARSGPQQLLATGMPEVRDTRFQDFGTLVPSRPFAGEFAGESVAAETPVGAQFAVNADEPNFEEPNVIGANAAGVAENPATSELESTETKPAETAASDTQSPEAIAAQLTDFDAAIRSPSDVAPTDVAPSGATPTAALVSVDMVLAELKSKLDLAGAHETGAAARVGEPEPVPDPVPDPVNVAAPVEVEMPEPESVPAPQVMSAPGPESVTLAASTSAASTTEGVDTEVMVARIIQTPSGDIVDIEEPAPIEAPATMQEMVIAEPISEGTRASSTSHSPSPFHAMQSSGMHSSGMQSVAMPGSRSMEDTVAELLRPMLRNWLAENMPKIVERALRKEIDDSLHSEHKTAAE